MGVSHSRLTRKSRSGLSAAKRVVFTDLSDQDFQPFCLRVRGEGQWSKCRDSNNPGLLGGGVRAEFGPGLLGDHLDHNRLKITHLDHNLGLLARGGGGVKTLTIQDC
jgi:hypothetical protein